MIALVLLLVSYVEAEPTAVPRFESYPAADAFRGTPAPPRFARREDAAFQTRIRQGAAAGPNFAGRFTIAQWGCGTACVALRVIDARLGNIYPSPFGSLGWMSKVAKYEGKYVSDEPTFKPLDYRLDSRLLIVRGCPEHDGCASYFYEWTGARFRLIQKIAAVAVPD